MPQPAHTPSHYPNFPTHTSHHATRSPPRWQRRIFLQHARIFQHVCPLAARARVAVLEVLAEVIGAEELLGAVAFPEFVMVLQMAYALVPVLLRGLAAMAYRAHAGALELLATVPARVGLAGP